MKKPNLQRLAQRSKIYLRKASPTILSGLGAAGVIVTSVLAVHATPKALRKIRADSKVNHDGDPEAYSKLEAVRSAWVCYIPAAISGTATIFCIFGANVLSKHQQAALTSAWLDDDLYTIHVDLDVAAAKKELQGTNTAANFGENYIIAEAMINTVLYAREDYKGTGTPDLFITPHMLNQMLLARDINGRRIYSSKTELATALNVGSINTAEQFEGKTRTTSDSKKKKLVAIIANLADYSLGATKGGEVTHFTQFDIDFNQEKSLLETRCSGALTRVYSAIAIEEDVTTASSGSEDHTA